jgi:hypothetical protein
MILHFFYPEPALLYIVVGADNGIDTCDYPHQPRDVALCYVGHDEAYNGYPAGRVTMIC